MNSTLTIEPLNSTCAPADRQGLSSSPQTTLEPPTERGGGAVPFWSAQLKFEERFETFIAMLSLVYLIGGIGFAGLLLFYALGR
jgi:hypothetical protein